MKFTASQIAQKINGDIEGDSEISVHELSKIEEAKSGSITFLSNPKYTNYLYTTKASIAIVENKFQTEKKSFPTLIRVKDPYIAFTKLIELYESSKIIRMGVSSVSSVHDSIVLSKNLYVGDFSVVEKNSSLGKNVKIYPNCFIGENVKIGDNTVIMPGVNILYNSEIGKNCVIHSGCVIGSDGFGFALNRNGSYKKIPHNGNVVIKDNVDIGANCSIDRATLGSTIIHNGVKLDNQIQIAHNVEIESHTVIAAQSGIAGSSKIGKNCIIGGQTGFAGHLTIGNNSKIQGKAGVISSLPENSKVQGNPAINYSDYTKSYVHFKNLRKIEARLSKVEKEIKS